MPQLDTTPSSAKTDFSCPHCKAHTHHTWHNTHVKVTEDKSTPNLCGESWRNKIQEHFKEATDENSLNIKKTLYTWADKIESKKPFFNQNDKSISCYKTLSNVFVSECYNCNDISLWIHDKLIYPQYSLNAQPNEDLETHIQDIYIEASDIVEHSPRGAAALLRLCVQHICIQLGQPGKNINDDIAALVKAGLDPHIQQALDIVRVIGNDSVHPGIININDNKEVAYKLFELVNLIADTMITNPKKIEDLYNTLPKGKLEGINNRNKKALKA